jgi:hypothetical protein
MGDIMGEKIAHCPPLLLTEGSFRNNMPMGDLIGEQITCPLPIKSPREMVIFHISHDFLQIFASKLT